MEPIPSGSFLVCIFKNIIGRESVEKQDIGRIVSFSHNIAYYVVKIRFSNCIVGY